MQDAFFFFAQLTTADKEVCRHSLTVSKILLQSQLVPFEPKYLACVRVSFLHRRMPLLSFADHRALLCGHEFASARIMGRGFERDDLMAILDSIDDAVVKLNAQAQFVAMNQAAMTIYQRLGLDP